MREKRRMKMKTKQGRTGRALICALEALLL
jgi:hypothetical protein